MKDESSMNSRQYRVSSAEYGVSSEEYRVSSQEYGVSSQEYGVSSQEYGVSSEEYGRAAFLTFALHVQRFESENESFFIYCNTSMWKIEECQLEMQCLKVMMMMMNRSIEEERYENGKK